MKVRKLIGSVVLGVFFLVMVIISFTVPWEIRKDLIKAAAQEDQTIKTLYNEVDEIQDGLFLQEQGIWFRSLEADQKFVSLEKINKSLIKDLKILENQLKELSKPTVEPNIVKGEESMALVKAAAKTINSVVHIELKGGGQASGVAISEYLILTARHFTEKQVYFKITLNNGKVVYANRAISHKDHDIAFICLEKTRWSDGELILHPAELRSGEGLELGQEVYIIGSPFGKINFNSLTSGIVSAVKRNYDELNIDKYGREKDYGWSVAFQTDGGGVPGNSGCPVFTLDGKVRGILVGGFSPIHIVVMPVDLILDDIEEINSMFVRDKYYLEKLLDGRLDKIYSWYQDKKLELDEIQEMIQRIKVFMDEVDGFTQPTGNQS